MRHLIFSTETRRSIITVGALTCFFIFGGSTSAEPHEAYGPEAVVIYPVPSTVVIEKAVENAIQFQRLAAEWRLQRGATSSISEMSACPAYLSIMGMGKDALPSLIAQLRQEGDDPDHWFVALHHIAKTDPIPDEDKGDTVMMAKAWLDWADQEGNAW